ncbi:GGDEF domain-containing protein [Treponema sp. C6A8]|uniref:GGDEF domain-containing protein n=1 Tax=Treponema sp. C6A8 TaxID=1410609 RepID=UPI0004805431|nr:GGDEF domain-containing protein [Treponema sp. C6A8]
MNAEKMTTQNIKPLGRSIALGCIIFIITLCLVLGITSHLSYKRSLYQGYESYIIDILNYVETSIDAEDLKKCIETTERSPKYDELEKFMDGIKEDFNIHYLYIVKPLNRNHTGNVMSVLSAENYYDRYIDTEGNLYLGWISDDEFDLPTVNKLFEIMDKRIPVFFEEKTEWGFDYTGALTLYDSKSNAYAILGVDIDITMLKKLLHKQAIFTAGIIIILGLIFMVIFLLWSRTNVIRPITMLSRSAVLFVQKSHGQRNINQLQFNPPEIKQKNEVYKLCAAIEQMTHDMQDYVVDLVSAELDSELLKKQASQMTELANKDSLTGVRNKTAYDKEMMKLQFMMETARAEPFGIAMIDLNFLKKTNDTYGHEHGNISIQRLCHLVCNIFEHSPVFRIGGDEFVVILKGQDYQNIINLTNEFNQVLSEYAANDSLEPWEKVSAAIGYALFDPNIDTNVDNVFKRADQKMYARKKQMKAVREV